MHALEEKLERLKSLPAGGGGNFYHSVRGSASALPRAMVASTLEGQTSFAEPFRLLGFKKMRTFSELAANLWA